MHEYKTARLIFNFMEFASWAIVAVGALIAISGFALDGQSRGMIPIAATSLLAGFLVGIFGVFCVMVVQMGRATVDTAQMTGRMLRISEEQLRIVKGQPGLGDRPLASQGPPPIAKPAEKTEPEPESRPEAKPPVQEERAPIAAEPVKQMETPRQTYTMRRLVREVIRHENGEISRTDDGFFIEDRRFETLADAQSHLEAARSVRDPKS